MCKAGQDFGLFFFEFSCYILFIESHIFFVFWLKVVGLLEIGPKSIQIWI